MGLDRVEYVAGLRRVLSTVVDVEEKRQVHLDSIEPLSLPMRPTSDFWACFTALGFESESNSILILPLLVPTRSLALIWIDTRCR